MAAAEEVAAAVAAAAEVCRKNMRGTSSNPWCPECETVWNRDVNAARNIRQVFLHMIAHGHSRPQGFKHEGALDNVPSPAPAA